MEPRLRSLNGFLLRPIFLNLDDGKRASVRGGRIGLIVSSDDFDPWGMIVEGRSTNQGAMTASFCMVATIPKWETLLFGKVTLESSPELGMESRSILTHARGEVKKALENPHAIDAKFYKPGKKFLGYYRPKKESEDGKLGEEGNSIAESETAK